MFRISKKFPLSTFFLECQIFSPFSKMCSGIKKCFLFSKFDQKCKTYSCILNLFTVHIFQKNRKKLCGLKRNYSEFQEIFWKRLNSIFDLPCSYSYTVPWLDGYRAGQAPLASNMALQAVSREFDSLFFLRGSLIPWWCVQLLLFWFCQHLWAAATAWTDPDWVSPSAKWSVFFHQTVHFFSFIDGIGG